MSSGWKSSVRLVLKVVNAILVFVFLTLLLFVHCKSNGDGSVITIFQVLMLDYGDTQMYAIDELYYLDSQFLTLPYQVHYSALRIVHHSTLYLILYLQSYTALPVHLLMGPNLANLSIE